MDPSNNRSIKPPVSSDIKKIDGSFTKRNFWIIIAAVAVVLIGSGVWFIFNKIKALTHSRYQNITFSDTGKNTILYEKDGVFMQAYNADVKVIKLNIQAGATSYKIDDTTSQLFIADTRAFQNRFQFESHEEGTAFLIDLTSKSGKQTKITNGDPDSVKIKLNRNPEWEIDLDASASTIDFDLSKFKLRSIKIKGGAGDYKLKLGQALSLTNVVFDTGVADITIEIPKNAACRIETKSQFSSTTFDGFNKKGNGGYETSEYPSAKNKILIKFNGDISDYKVSKY